MAGVILSSIIPAKDSKAGPSFSPTCSIAGDMASSMPSKTPPTAESNAGDASYSGFNSVSPKRPMAAPMFMNAPSNVSAIFCAPPPTYSFIASENVLKSTSPLDTMSAMSSDATPIFFDKMS